MTNWLGDGAAKIGSTAKNANVQAKTTEERWDGQIFRATRCPGKEALLREKRSPVLFGCFFFAGTACHGLPIRYLQIPFYHL